MTLHTKRSYARNYTDAHIMFADSTTGKYTSGVMHNISVDGMYFISKASLEPGTLIDIEILEQSDDYHIPGFKGRGYAAKVIWCTRLPGFPHYGIGVRFHRSENGQGH